MKTAGPTPCQTVSRSAWIWPVALAAVIFAWSSRSRVPDVVPWIPHFDKGVHFSVYGMLGLLIARTRFQGRADMSYPPMLKTIVAAEMTSPPYLDLGLGARRALLAVGLTSLYGVSDEWHQSFVPGRSAEVADWVADTLGAAIVVGAYAGSPRLRRWMETPARIVRRQVPPQPVSSP